MISEIFNTIKTTQQVINTAIDAQISQMNCEVNDLSKNITEIVNFSLLIEVSRTSEDSEEQKNILDNINTSLKTHIKKLLNLLIKQKVHIPYNELYKMIDKEQVPSSTLLMKRKIFHNIIRPQDLEDEEIKALTNSNTSINAIKTEASPVMVIDKKAITRKAEAVTKIINKISRNLRKIIGSVDNAPRSITTTEYLNSQAKQMLNDEVDDAQKKLNITSFDVEIQQKWQKLEMLLLIIKAKKETQQKIDEEVFSLDVLNKSVTTLIEKITGIEAQKERANVFKAAFQSLKDQALSLQQAINTELIRLPVPLILNSDVKIDSQQNETMYVPRIESQAYDSIDPQYVPPSGGIFRLPSIGAGGLLNNKKRKYSAGMFSNNSSSSSSSSSSNNPSDAMSSSSDEEDTQKTDDIDLNSLATSCTGYGK